MLLAKPNYKVCSITIKLTFDLAICGADCTIGNRSEYLQSCLTTIVLYILGSSLINDYIYHIIMQIGWNRITKTFRTMNTRCEDFDDDDDGLGDDVGYTDGVAIIPTEIPFTTRA